MADVNNPPARGGIAKRKRGRPRRIPLDAAPAASTPAQGGGSRSSSASGSNQNMVDLEEHINDLGDSWETESLFEDILDDLAEDNHEPAKRGSDGEACTPEESARYRQQLRAIGPEELCRRTVDAGTITAKRLLTAFGVRPPDFLEGEPDESYFGLLSLALSRELLKRAKLTEYNSVQDAVHLLQKSRNIIVLTGAGISTSLGIPDFRSKEIGLYSRLAHLGLNDPQEVFDIHVFKEDPRIFYSVARDILPSTDRYTPTHAFIAMLQQRGKLLTNYSQNIDNLEAKAGISPSKLIQCHGSFATATCVTCRYRVEGESLYPTIKAGQIPRCPRCAAGNGRRGGSAAGAAVAAARKQRKALARESSSGRGSLSRSNSFDNAPSGVSTPSGSSAARGRGRRRGRPPGKVGRPRGRPRRQNRRASSDDDNDDDDADGEFNPSRGGVMKPDITFFGEALPDEFSRRLTEHDRDKADLVVVIGTSLKVAPVSEVVPYMPPNVPAIYISRTPVNHINFDIDLLGDCDVVVSELCRVAGWSLEHEMIPANQQISVEAVPGFTSRHVFTDVTPGLVKAETAATATTAIGTEPFVPKLEEALVVGNLVDNADDNDTAEVMDATDEEDTIEVENPDDVDVEDAEDDVDAEDVDDAEDATRLSATSTSIAVAAAPAVKTDVVVGIREIPAAPTSMPAPPPPTPLHENAAL